MNSKHTRCRKTMENKGIFHHLSNQNFNVYNKLFSNCPFINFKLRFQFPETKLPSNEFGYLFNVFFGHTSLPFIWFFGSLNLKYSAMSVPCRGKFRKNTFQTHTIYKQWLFCVFFFFSSSFLRRFKVYERLILPFPIVFHFIPFIAFVNLSLFHLIFQYNPKTLNEETSLTLLLNLV